MGSTNLIQSGKTGTRKRGAGLCSEDLILVTNDEAWGPLGAKGAKSLASGPKCPGGQQRRQH